MLRPLTVTLTPEELVRVKVEARRIIKENERDGCKPRRGAPTGLEGHLITLRGCKGELATAIRLGLPWVDGGRPRSAIDVGGLVEVRTCAEAHHRLIIHPEDKEEVPFVDACCSAEVDACFVTLRGWCMAEAVKRPELWSDPSKKDRPAYFAPSRALHDMKTIFPWLDIPDPGERL
jgi:hypothetical protein